MKPFNSLKKNHFELYPNDECKGNINAKCPSPVHIIEKIKLRKIYFLTFLAKQKQVHKEKHRVPKIK